MPSSSDPLAVQLVAAIHIVLARVPGLAQYGSDGQVVNILDYEPSSLQALPTLYTLLDSFQKLEDGDVATLQYTHIHRLCIAWQNNEYAEREIRPFIDLLPEALEADSQLQGLLSSPEASPISLRGMVKISQGRAVFVRVGDTIYRAIDFTSVATCKRQRVPRYVP